MNLILYWIKRNILIMQIQHTFDTVYLLFCYNQHKGWDIITLSNCNETRIIQEPVSCPSSAITYSRFVFMNQSDIFQYYYPNIGLVHKDISLIDHSFILNDYKSTCYLLDIDHIINLDWAKTKECSILTYYLLKIHIDPIVSLEDETLLLNNIEGHVPLETYAIGIYDTHGIYYNDVKYDSIYDLARWRTYHTGKTFELQRIVSQTKPIIGTVTQKITIKGIYPINDLLTYSEKKEHISNDFNIVLT